jgi:hypothetical protein
MRVTDASMLPRGLSEPLEEALNLDVGEVTQRHCYVLTAELFPHLVHHSR